MIFDVVTMFPGMFAGPLQDSILARARRSGRIAVRLHELRRWGVGPHRVVDSPPYGGGGGMILRPEPVFGAVDWIREAYPEPNERIVLLSPQGSRLDHPTAERLARYRRLIMICGRYEGVDERVREDLADEELSVGDMVLTGGELPALVAVDAVSRLIPGVLGRAGAADDDSFADGLLDSPYYTRPEVFRGSRVPEILLSGDHGAVARWRAEKARQATRDKRPDLLDRQDGP
ncbi:MAG: tRNA (guanosine(37)-N1)-methyltransferase TrmD [bacterium]|nr:tRNA (guanosine(37)-N1)-methyltransferase TrmD [bacterium]